MRNYRELDVWKIGMEIVKDVYVIANKLPDDEKFGLRNQITRAAVSIPLDIAKGKSRNSEKDYKRFLEIAIGSLFELETLLIIIKELKMVSEVNMVKLFEKINKEGKQINSLINVINMSIKADSQQLNAIK